MYYDSQLHSTQTIFPRIWQSRRVVFTKNIIAFAYVGDNNMLDYVPLCEICGIDNLDHEVDQRGSSTLQLEKAVNALHALQIQTVPEGHNSGRKYFLQADTELQRNELMTQLKSLVDRASTESISSFKRRQMVIKRVYNSNMVQSIAALLIVMVRFL